MNIELPKEFFLGADKKDICNKNKVIFSDDNKTVEVSPIIEEDGIGVPIPKEFIEKDNVAKIDMIFVENKEKEIKESEVSLETKDNAILIHSTKMGTGIPMKIYAIK